VVALLPVAPTPLARDLAPIVPRFISDGTWRTYVGGGCTIIPVPLPSGMPWSMESLRWSSATGLDLPMPGGYFLGPSSETDRSGRFTSPARSTSDLLAEVARTGAPVLVDDTVREQAVEDLRYWGAAVVVLGKRANEGLLRKTVEQLLGPAQRVQDVWLWDVRPVSCRTR
jgi:hypothetical protein